MFGFAQHDVIDDDEGHDDRQQYLQRGRKQDEYPAHGKGHPIRFHPMHQATEQVHVQHRAR